MTFFSGLFRRIRGIIPTIRDRSVPWWKKAIFIIGIVYLLLPFDLIPPLVPVFGWLDDVLLWIAILYFMGPELDKHIPENTAAGGNKKYRYKDEDVQEVDFTVTEEEETDER